MAREYDISGAAGQCRSCGREFAAGEEFLAALFDAGEEFRREDYCPACWLERAKQAPAPFSCWRGRMPPPQQPKRPTVDSEVLVDFLARLAEEQEPAKVNFRFVLALMLMRKRLLIYDGRSTDEAGREVWKMHYRNQGETVQVIRPELSEQQVAEVASRLGEIFEVSP
jgi:hypothetical protein